jgi:hypothetical protein
MLVILILAIATITCIGGLLTVSHAGEKESICDYNYIEN